MVTFDRLGALVSEYLQRLMHYRRMKAAVESELASDYPPKTFEQRKQRIAELQSLADGIADVRGRMSAEVEAIAKHVRDPELLYQLVIAADTDGQQFQSLMPRVSAMIRSAINTDGDHGDQDAPNWRSDSSLSTTDQNILQAAEELDGGLRDSWFTSALIAKRAGCNESYMRRRAGKLSTYLERSDSGYRPRKRRGNTEVTQR